MDIRRAKYLLPNALTLCSVFAGFHSIYLSLNATSVAQMSLAAWLLVVAMACDGLDGRVARMTKTESDLGVQLDSLADAISFGVAPAFLMYAWGLKPLGFWGLSIAFVFAACAVLRLARFNVMANQSHGVMRYFLGLPTPLAAGAVISIVMAHLAVTGHTSTGAPYSVALMALMLGGLMVSNVRYRTFKDTNFRGRAGVGLLGVVITCVGLGLITKPSVAFVLLMCAYILLGLVGGVVHFSKAMLGDDIDYPDRDYDDVFTPSLNDDE